ncbi:2407_t:CDS:2 [Gigaspora rosea]|nr:2407_t:CDS:2 [Gigaspora rosea]
MHGYFSSVPFTSCTFIEFLRRLDSEQDLKSTEQRSIHGIYTKILNSLSVDQDIPKFAQDKAKNLIREMLTSKEVTSFWDSIVMVLTLLGCKTRRIYGGRRIIGSLLFVEECIDSTIDKGSDIKLLGFQCIEYIIDFYAMELSAPGLYFMYHIGQASIPTSVRTMTHFIDD